MNGIQLQNDRLIVNNPSQNAKSQHHFTSTKQRRGWIHQLETWIIRNRHRQELLRRPEYLLEDIGLTRDQIITENNTPFWKSGIY